MNRLFGFLLGSFIIGTISACVNANPAEGELTGLFLEDKTAWNAPCNKNKTYYVEGASLTWFQAAVSCRRQNKVLASINCQEENDLLKELLITQGYPVVGPTDWGSAFWTSGVRMDGAPKTDKWSWLSSGSNVQYFNWQAAQPDNAGNDEYCIQVYLPGDLHWNDYNCMLATKYICEDAQP